MAIYYGGDYGGDITMYGGDTMVICTAVICTVATMYGGDYVRR